MLLDDDADAQQVDDASAAAAARRATRCSAWCGCGTRRLSAGQVARVRELFAPMTRAATAAYDRADGTRQRARDAFRRWASRGRRRRRSRPSCCSPAPRRVTSAAPRAVAMLHDAGLARPLARADRSGRLRAVPDRGAAARHAVAGDAAPGHPSPRLGSSGVEVRPATGCWSAPGGPPACRTASARERACPAAARNLWFGAGPHFCLGAPLATAEVEAIARRGARRARGGRPGPGRAPLGRRASAGPVVRTARAAGDRPQVPRRDGRRRSSRGPSSRLRHTRSPDRVAAASAPTYRVSPTATWPTRCAVAQPALRRDGMQAGDGVLFAVRPSARRRSWRRWPWLPRAAW